MYHFKLLLQKSCWVIKRKNIHAWVERNLLFNPKTVFKSRILSILCRIGVKRGIGVEWKGLQVEMRCSESSELMNTLKECYWSANLILWAHVLMEEYGMGRTEKQLSGGRPLSAGTHCCQGMHLMMPLENRGNKIP